MRIGRVRGTVTLNRRHPSVAGARFKLVVPLSLADLQAPGSAAESAEELVVYDDLGAAEGHLIAFSEGREAAQPFHPDVKPVDAYCAAILDQIVIHKSTQK